jgi:hypothetical protein
VNTAELPKYKCHKEVWALKIKAINILQVAETQREVYTLHPEDERFAPFEVTPEFIRTHNAHAGGYFVVYKDGYRSFSPASAFEEGYTKM